MSDIPFSEICLILRLYIRALTGDDIAINLSKETFQNYPHPCPEALKLPEQIHKFANWSDNFWLYKVYTSHQLGYFLYDSFSFPHDQFSLSFPEPDLATRIFYILEDARVDSCLQREYQGLARDIKRFRQSRLVKGGNWKESWPAKIEAMIWERLFNTNSTTSNHPSPHAVPWEPWVWEVISRLTDPDATGYDSALGTLFLYPIISQLPTCEMDKTNLHQEGSLPIPIVWEKNYTQDSSYSYPLQDIDIGSLIQAPRKSPSIPGLSYPIPWEYLKDLLDKGIKIELSEILSGALPNSSGLFINQLSSLISLRAKAQLDNVAKAQTKTLCENRKKPKENIALNHYYYYDEWDYIRHDYRPKWCCLTENIPETDTSTFVEETLSQHSSLITDLRKQFQKLRPQKYLKIKRLFTGEELELDALIEDVVDKKSGKSPSGKIYLERRKVERDVGAIFLLDMSASTDERVPDSQKRIIDIEKEAMILMAEAMDSLGDKYAIFGFSGYGRDKVEFFNIKEFCEQYSQTIKARIGGIKPHRSTRMGPAIRHATYKLNRQCAKLKLLLLLSDGYPQDFDYGEDRTSREYALHDTMVALKESQRAGLKTFCITVDPCGHDYLRAMCGGPDYMVIKDVCQLPQELPKIYYHLTLEK